MIKKPSLKLAASSGLFLTLAQLAKASALPLLIIFLLVYVGKQLFTIIYRHRPLILRQFFIYPLLTIFIFLLLMSPYLKQSKQKYGQYFYNIEQFCAWYDSWNECQQDINRYRYTKHYPNLLEDQIPSLSKYLREHTPSQIITRLVGGFFATTDLVSWASPSFGYHYYFNAFIFCLTILTSLTFYKLKPLLKKYFWEIIFLILIIVVYLLGISWYLPITVTNRYILALFLPTMFSLYLWLLKQMKIFDKYNTNNCSYPLTTIFNYICLLTITTYALVVVFFLTAVINGGN